jgi:hypothetical protein
MNCARMDWVDWFACASGLGFSGTSFGRKKPALLAPNERFTGESLEYGDAGCWVGSEGR